MNQKPYSSNEFHLGINLIIKKNILTIFLVHIVWKVNQLPSNTFSIRRKQEVVVSAAADELVGVVSGLPL